MSTSRGACALTARSPPALSSSVGARSKRRRSSSSRSHQRSNASVGRLTPTDRAPPPPGPAPSLPIPRRRLRRLRLDRRPRGLAPPRALRLRAPPRVVPPPPRRDRGRPRAHPASPPRRGVALALGPRQARRHPRGRGAVRRDPRLERAPRLRRPRLRRPRGGTAPDLRTPRRARAREGPDEINPREMRRRGSRAPPLPLRADVLAPSRAVAAQGEPRGRAPRGGRLRARGRLPGPGGRARLAHARTGIPGLARAGKTAGVGGVPRRVRFPRAPRRPRRLAVRLAG
jgi:hypothetical protein